MIFFTTIGNVGMVWIAICVLLLFNKKSRKAGFIGLIALLITEILCNQLIKEWVQRERPFEHIADFNLLIKNPNSYSFPSGHTTASFAVAIVISKYIRKLMIPTLVLAILISYSRMYLYVHYPSDILAGIILGVICSVLAIYTFQLFSQLIKNKKSKDKMIA